MAEETIVITLRLLSQDPTDDKSSLVQVMSWCRQETEPLLTRIYVAIGCHWATMSQSPLIKEAPVR